MLIDYKTFNDLWLTFDVYKLTYNIYMALVPFFIKLHISNYVLIRLALIIWAYTVTRVDVETFSTCENPNKRHRFFLILFFIDGNEGIFTMKNCLRTQFEFLCQFEHAFSTRYSEIKFNIGYLFVLCTQHKDK